MTTAHYVPGLLPVPASALPSALPARKFFHRLARGVAAAHRRTVEARIARFIQQSGGARLTDDLERAIERSFLFEGRRLVPAPSSESRR